MRRREFISLLGSGAVAWPLAARAQQPEQMRRIGVLLSQAESDSVAQSYIATFGARLRELGWTEGKNLLIDYRWGGGNTTRMPPLARELVVLQPHALLAATAVSAVQLRQYTLTIPIIFTQVGDPVALGLVTNLARPNGNITGFTSFDYAIGGKWLQALKECAPGLARVAVFFRIGEPVEHSIRDRDRGGSFVGGSGPGPVSGAKRDGDRASLRRLPGGGDRCGHRGPHSCRFAASWADHCPCGETSPARNLPLPLFCGGRRAHVLRYRYVEPISASGALYRPHPERGKAVRSACPAADQVRTNHQSHDCKGFLG